MNDWYKEVRLTEEGGSILHGAIFPSFLTVFPDPQYHCPYLIRIDPFFSSPEVLGMSECLQRAG